MTTPAKPQSLARTPDLDAIRETVREHYGAAARRAAGIEEPASAAACCEPGSCGCGAPAAQESRTGSSTACCGSDTSNSCCGGKAMEWDPITANLYEDGETAGLPAEALLASLGCGNPTALAQLHEGEVVLDLGSGGGIDVLLSARRVGPTGHAYGLDMTDDMLALAESNKRKAGAANVDFLRGHIEAIPLPDASVDVIISNCVINLSGDKRRVLAEAYRVLRPGGRFAVSDVGVKKGIPTVVRRSMELWAGCVAGALEDEEFIALLREVGFEDPSVEPTRIYTADDAKALVAGGGFKDAVAHTVEGKIMSAFVRATKPATAPVDRVAPALRAATAGDLPAITQLLRAAELPTDGVEALVGDFIVAEAPQGIVGTGAVERAGNDGLLRSVAVAAGWRDRGIGRTIVERLMRDARDERLRALYLLTQTAERWFPEFGFHAVARDAVPAAVQATAEFASVCPSTATVMCCPLSP
jgi:ubiquinone/menaquinone biosynthesis C-methylase UbiE/N-acetylglutamate synthase-like GNAT family acetyltransferase